MRDFISSAIREYGSDLLFSVLTDAIDYAKIEKSWNEKHRCYHGVNHLKQLIDLIESGSFDQKTREKLYLIAIFHDIVYDPYSMDNEEKSSEVYKSMVGDNFDQEVYDAILDTKNHTKEPSNKVSEIFLKFDIHNLLYGSVNDMIGDSHLLIREFAKYDWHLMKAGRIAFMENISPYILKINPKSEVTNYIEWLKNYEPKIAVFAGTFYPFHRGHLDILRKAEKIFDKVIVACGNNPIKSDGFDRDEYLKELGKNLPNNQIESFDGFLTDYISTKNYPVTIVKGLRNPSDFDSEKLQLRYMEDMNPDLKIVYIISDRKYEHISSSGVKMIDFIEAKNNGDRDLTSKYLL